MTPDEFRAVGVICVTPDNQHEPWLGAVERGDLALIRLLLEYGADLSHKNKAGLTAAEIARAQGKVRVGGSTPSGRAVTCWVRSGHMSNGLCPNDGGRGSLQRQCDPALHLGRAIRAINVAAQLPASAERNR